jgi:hypothetical protein
MVRKILGICALAALSVLGSSVVAKADSLEPFIYQSDGNTFVWQLPLSPTLDPGDVYPDEGFILNNVMVSENGGVPVLGSFGFYNALCSGGFDLTEGANFMIGTGWVPLYTGPESNPTFIPGTYQLTDYGINEAGLPGTLVIGTPEPSAFTLLIFGFLALLLAFYSKKFFESQAPRAAKV